MYNQASSSTCGMDVPFLYHCDTASTSRFVAVPVGQGRINLGYIPRHNAGARTSIKVTAAPDGSPSQVTKTYGPSSGYFQINDVLTDMGLTPAQAANVGLWVQLVSPDTNTSYFAYITINDGIPAQGKPGTSDPLMRLPNSLATIPPNLQ